MDNIIKINDNDLSIKEFNNQRVVSFKDIDEVHNRPEGTARKAFNRNKDRFVENEDYYMITRKNSMSVSWTLGYIPPKGITLLTETGYLMIVKTFDDELAWNAQRQLVNSYFKIKKIEQTIQSIDYSPIMLEINSLKNDIQSIKYLTVRQQPTKQYSKWRKKTTPKIKLLADYFGETQLTILSNLYIKLEDLYDIDLSVYKFDYCFEMNLDNCSQLDVIENNKDLRNMFDLLLSSLLDKYSLQNDIEENIKRKTIFD